MEKMVGGSKGEMGMEDEIDDALRWRLMDFEWEMIGMEQTELSHLIFDLMGLRDHLEVIGGLNMEFGTLKTRSKICRIVGLTAARAAARQCSETGLFWVVSAIFSLCALQKALQRTGVAQ